jgi:hypothetical protein
VSRREEWRRAWRAVRADGWKGDLIPAMRAWAVWALHARRTMDPLDSARSCRLWPCLMVCVCDRCRVRGVRGGKAPWRAPRLMVTRLGDIVPFKRGA